MQHRKKYNMDMCHGSLFSQIFRFSIPLLLTNIMVMLFHAADLIVLGQFAPDNVKTAATAAVGATFALHILLTVFFSGFSAGVNAVTARYIGAKDNKKVSETVHTSITLGIYASFVIMIFGLFLSRPALEMISTPADVIDKAVIYLQIYCIGLPFSSLYFIGAAILRAIGDTRRPLLFIMIAGAVNVLLNLFFVIVFRMDSAGVATATQLSNALSALLVLRTLYKSGGAVRMYFNKLRFHWQTLKEILWIGIPSGIQGMLFCISNVFIQSSVNSLGSAAMAGNAASQSLETMANASSGVFMHTAMSFVGQNYGGKKYKRIIRSILISIMYAALFAAAFGVFFLFTGRQLLGLYNPDPVVINWGMDRLVIMMSTHWLCNIMDTILGSLRGLGHSVKPTMTSIVGICGFRILWVLMIFPHYNTLQSLAVSYPFSWLVTGLINGIILFFVCRNMLIRARNARL